MPDAHLAGVRLFYEERGNGLPILCIHGAGSSSLLWEDAAERLASYGRVITYDRRGCGRSERPQDYERTTVAEQADDAAALLDELHAAPAAVIARSYGGAVALDLALRHPRHVRALALLEGDALGLSAVAHQWTRQLRSKLLDTVQRDGIASAPAALFAEVMGPGAWDSLPARIKGVLRDNAPALLAELGYVDEPAPEAESIATIRVPALLVEAESSPMEQRDMTRALVEALPAARHVVVPGGHLIDPASAPVVEFLREVART